MNLIILKSPPSSDLEAAELILACAAFEQAPALLLLGQGIHWALKDAGSIRADSKALNKLFSALPMYDCDQIYVEQDSLNNHQFNANQLHPFCTITDTQDIKKLMSQAKKTVAF